MENKRKMLNCWLKEKGRIAVALSGGLDSSALLAEAASVLGPDNCLAMTASSPYMMQREVSDAARLASRLNVRILKLEFAIPESIKENPPLRCYLCKKEIFSKIKAIAEQEGFPDLADGTNADDLSDYRPGMRALKELQVLSPFLECGMGKSDIRKIAESHELEVAQKPAYACLLTRLEHGTKIEVPILERIEKAEVYLNEIGFKQVRVRVNGESARIEVPADSQPILFEMRTAVSCKLKSLGFKHVSMDMDGYSMGGMNQPVS